MGRIIIFTGKGGVGKTSTAAAHGVKAAKEGIKTLIVSTDAAHNLSDLFGMPIKEEPTQVIENLYALEIDHNYEMEKHYGTISKAFQSFMITSGNKEAEETLEDIIVFPGIEELFSLIKIQELYQGGEYELIIVDCAPTGETLSLLKFPELFAWYMEKLFPLEKVALKVLRPISKVAFKVDLPDQTAMNDIEKLYMTLSELQLLLKNREICSIRIVTIPEKMVVEETKRSYMYLNLYNFNVDAIYINRMIPKDIDNPFFKQWQTLQEKYLEEIQLAFSHLPTYRMKWYEVDLNGVEALWRIVKDSLQDMEIFKVLKLTQSDTFEKTDKGYKLQVLVPFSTKTDFDLFESGAEIIIKIGNFKRNIPLPNVMKKYSVASAKWNDGALDIYFE